MYTVVVTRCGMNRFHKLMMYSFSQEECFRINCSLLPMFVPPIPWTAPDSGGYLLTPSK